MGQAVICQNRRTKTAYMVEQTGVNLYSLEELAFSCITISVWSIRDSSMKDSVGGWNRSSAAGIWQSEYGREQRQEET